MSSMARKCGSRTRPTQGSFSLWPTSTSPKATRASRALSSRNPTPDSESAARSQSSASARPAQRPWCSRARASLPLLCSARSDMATSTPSSCSTRAASASGRR
eukprot:Amastigsp_a1896_112.p4 type:complete len:103 gc:universal Amastigsp_a1896_112:729-421(-)